MLRSRALSQDIFPFLETQLALVMSCGPSNPLQNLQKHTSSDRSLQQEAASGSQQQRPGSNFRHNNAVLDQRLEADFTNFQQHQHQQQHHMNGVFDDASYMTMTMGQRQNQQQRQQQQQQQQQQNWANDFSNLSISGTSQQQFSQNQQNQQQVAPGWKSEFSQSSGIQQNQPYSTFQQPYMMNRSMISQNMTNSIYQQQQSQQQQSQQPQHISNDIFEQAFSNVEASIKLSEQHIEQPQDLQQEQPQDEFHEDTEQFSQVAKQIAHNLSSDKSEKFQQSNFLSLMKQIANKEVLMNKEGSKLVYTDGTNINDNIETSSNGKQRESNTMSKALEDPLIHFNPNDKTEGDFNSPFEMAKATGFVEHENNWEEVYDDYQNDTNLDI